jgi:hypothetical protein
MSSYCLVIIGKRLPDGAKFSWMILGAGENLVGTSYPSMDESCGKVMV